MKKTLLATTGFFASSTMAFAGNYATAPIDDTVITMPERIGGSGAWIIPLVIITVLLLTLTGDDDDDSGCQDC